MKLKNTLIAAALLSAPVFAGTEATVAPAPVQEPAAKKLSGSLTMAYGTNYEGRGYVVSHSVAQGDSVVMAALKTSYDIGQPGKWSIENTIAYKVPVSGHTLYGNPKLGGNNIVGVHPEYGVPITGAQAGAAGMTIGEKNIENEFDVKTGLRYTAEKWNVGFGHTFVHGGLLGVMAKHFRDQGASVVNELYLAPEWTPYKWLALGCTMSYSFQGIQGTWFEPYVTVKAPIVGSPEDIKVAGVLQLGATFSYSYFHDSHHACANGCQNVYVKFSTPWFIKKNLILTPGVGFHWLGDGGLKANKHSEAKYATGNPYNVPFRNFGVVGTVALTYTF